jgi:hypothetical protein
MNEVRLSAARGHEEVVFDPHAAELAMLFSGQFTPSWKRSHRAESLSKAGIKYRLGSVVTT